MWWWSWGICAGISCYSDVLHEQRSDIYTDMIPIMTDDRSVPSKSTITPPGIYIARNRFTQEFAVIKVFQKRLLRKKHIRRRMRHEIRILSQLRAHPNILKLYGVYVSSHSFEIAFELARGGEILNRVLCQDADAAMSFTEQEISRVIASVASALAFMHQRQILHGEVRPEHVLYSDAEPDANVVLVDFGRASHWREFSFRHRQSSLSMWDDLHELKFLPPFVVRNKANTRLSWPQAAQIDIWALGVTMYVLLTAGQFPFDGSTNAQIEDQLVHFDHVQLHHAQMSRAAKDLLSRILCSDPARAMTSMGQVLQHPWIASTVASDVRWSDAEIQRRRAFAASYAQEVSISSLRRKTSQSSSVFMSRCHLNDCWNYSAEENESDEDEEEERPSFVSLNGQNQQLEALEAELPPSADSLMRQASVEFRRLSQTDANATTGISNTNGQQSTKAPPNHANLWQLLRKQRRFFSFRSNSSSSSSLTTTTA